MAEGSFALKYTECTSGSGKKLAGSGTETNVFSRELTADAMQPEQRQL